MIRAVHCHWDGYPRHVGRILHEFYSDGEKAMRLLRLGSLSSLGPSLAPPLWANHSFEHPARNVTVAYHRERGEDLRPPIPFSDVEDYRVNAKSRFMADYVYLLDNGVWLVAEGQEWVPVADILRKDGIILNRSVCRLDKGETGSLLDGVPTRYVGNLETRETSMANTCFIRLLAMCAGGAQAIELTDKLNRLVCEAARRMEGFDAGGLCIFDGTARQFMRNVVLEGFVKWGIDDAKATELMRFLQRHVEIRAAFIECCTPGSEFYGEITWADGRLTARELPQIWWPKEWRYDGDMTAVNKALEAYGVEREINMEAVK
ncbi:MAG: hypothetical protein IJJ33_16410 [Victivallales bacterium]|nr:hypothetical protein [Victivallales bacterium]